MSMKTVMIGNEDVREVRVGEGEKLCLIAGPCVIESRDLCMTIAEKVKTVCDFLGVAYVFKASFDKANRTSATSFRGPGLDTGMEILSEVREAFEVPVCSDIHLPEQAPDVAEVLDIIQIPAFLSRQTDLVEAAALTQKTVQVKKAQFMAPWDMQNVIEKITQHHNHNITLVERGSAFGYNRLVCDMGAIPGMQALGYPAIIDATHATQQPGGLGAASGGDAGLAKVLAKAAMAAGANGIFLETHPEPKEALSDAASMLPISELEELLKQCLAIYEAVR